MRYSLIILGVLLGIISVQAQVGDPEEEPTDSSEIEILWINKLKNKPSPTGVGEIKELLGDVHLKQKDMHLWCDTGYIMPNKQVEAFGNVQILQGDSLRIYSDSLFYDGIGRQAELKQEVVLEDGRATMFTDVLYYDLNTQIARYPNGATIISDSAELISRSGFYDANTNMAYFNDSVAISHPDYKLYAVDTLSFDVNNEIAYFHGPTYIYNEEKLIYCEDGFFNSQTNKAEFSKDAYYVNRTDEKSEKASADRIVFDGETESYFLYGNAYYKDDAQEVHADTIWYDGQTGRYNFEGNPRFQSLDSTQQLSIVSKHTSYDDEQGRMTFTDDVVVVDKEQGTTMTADTLNYFKEDGYAIAEGNVVFEDSTNNITINAGHAYYDNEGETVIASKQPVMTTLISGDTLWLTADTLVTVPDSIESDRRMLYAYNNTRFFKSDMQGAADSLVYSELDSTFWFYEKPVLWLDSTQFTAESIEVKLKDERIHQVNMYQDAFIVNTDDNVYYNQTKGRNASAFFRDNELYLMDIKGNGETVYYAKDDKGAYMGVNDIDCSDMFIYLTNNEIQKIKFVGQPAAVLYPVGQAPHNKLRLNGFVWLEHLRPKQKSDIFKPFVWDGDSSMF